MKNLKAKICKDTIFDEIWSRGMDKHKLFIFYTIFNQVENTAENQVKRQVADHLWDEIWWIQFVKSKP
jgi:hypothetical protein